MRQRDQGPKGSCKWQSPNVPEHACETRYNVYVGILSLLTFLKHMYECIIDVYYYYAVVEIVIDNTKFVNRNLFTLVYA